MCEDSSSSKWSISCTIRLETTTNRGKHTNNSSKGKGNNTINSKAEVHEQHHHSKPATQLPSETSPRRRETQRKLAPPQHRLFSPKPALPTFKRVLERRSQPACSQRQVLCARQQLQTSCLPCCPC